MSEISTKAEKFVENVRMILYLRLKLAAKAHGGNNHYAHLGHVCSAANIAWEAAKANGDTDCNYRCIYTVLNYIYNGVHGYIPNTMPQDYGAYLHYLTEAEKAAFVLRMTGGPVPSNDEIAGKRLSEEDKIAAEIRSICLSKGIENAVEEAKLVTQVMALKESGRLDAWSVSKFWYPEPHMATRDRVAM